MERKEFVEKEKIKILQKEAIISSIRFLTARVPGQRVIVGSHLW